MEAQQDEMQPKKHIAIKVLLALLPAIIFTQNYAWMTLNSKLGLAFLIIWGLMIWSVWQLTEKNHILERFFRQTEISFFLLPLSAIVFAFVLGSKVVSSTTDEMAQAGAAIGTAIGGTFIVVLSFIIGIAGGIIMHLIAGRYDKKLEKSGVSKPETIANKHGVVLSLAGVIVLALIFGSIDAGQEKKNDNEKVDRESAGVSEMSSSNEKAEKSNEVDLRITQKGFDKADIMTGSIQDQITMEFEFTNKTEKDIRGVEGKATLYDIFDNEIKTINVGYDKGIPAGQSKTWSAALTYNMFMDEDIKLKDTDLKDLKYEWEVEKVVYEDGEGVESGQAAQEGKVGLEIIEKGFNKADIMAGSMQDQITMELKFTNKTDKDIKGVQGTLTYYDIFDSKITAINIAYDKGIPAGQSKTWSSAIDYNQFIDGDKKLKSVDLKDLKYKWEVVDIIYSDGTKEPAE